MSLFRKNKIGRNSIKESLDNLPSGICFARPNGILVLYNRKMDALARELMGKDLQHLSELQAALVNPHESVKLINAEHGMYLFPDNTVWQFTERSITDSSGTRYIYIAATDVTELNRKENELKQENAELEEVNARARVFYAEIDQIVRDEENLALKAKIHDDLGLALLKSRQLLAAAPSLDEMRSMGAKWAHIAETLGISEEEVSRDSVFIPEDEIAELTELTRSIGIALHIDGKLPRNEQSARLILSAVRECAANAIRHAEASEMRITLTDINDKTKAEITNNGKAPTGDITEGGGLSSLRKRIEQTGGVMTLQSQPQFKLTMIVGH